MGWRKSGGGIVGETPAGAQDMLGHPEDFGGQPGTAQLGNRLVDVVLDPPELHLAVLNDRVRCARVAVPGLADTSRIHHLHPGKFQVKGKVGVSHAEKVGRERGTPELPGVGILAEILVKGIPGGRMDECEAEPIEFDRGLDGEPGEISQLAGIEQVPLDRAGGRHQLPEPGPFPGRDPVGDVVVMIPPDSRAGMLLDPVDTGRRIDSVVNQITGEQAGIERFADGLQSRPVGVDVGQDQDSQGQWPGMGQEEQRNCTKPRQGA